MKVQTKMQEAIWSPKQNRGYFEEIQMKKGICTVEEKIKVVHEFTNF